jgi:hypothetical protein
MEAPLLLSTKAMMEAIADNCRLGRKTKRLLA